MKLKPSLDEGLEAHRARPDRHSISGTTNRDAATLESNELKVETVGPIYEKENAILAPIAAGLTEWPP